VKHIYHHSSINSPPAHLPHQGFGFATQIASPDLIATLHMHNILKVMGWLVGWMGGWLRSWIINILKVWVGVEELDG